MDSVEVIMKVRKGAWERRAQRRFERREKKRFSFSIPTISQEKQWGRG